MDQMDPEISKVQQNTAYLINTQYEKVLLLKAHTGCSFNIVFFPQNIVNFLNSASSVGDRPAI